MWPFSFSVVSTVNKYLTWFLVRVDRPLNQQQGYEVSQTVRQTLCELQSLAARLCLRLAQYNATSCLARGLIGSIRR